MKRVLLPGACLVLLGCGLAACGEAESANIPRMNGRIPDWSIPAEYQGEWRGDVARCGGPNDGTMLVITPDELRFPDAVGKVMASSANATGITIVGEFKGQDMQWRRAIVFNLSPDGQSLTSGDEGATSVRRKCP